MYELFVTLYIRPSLWSRGNIVASHPAGPGSITVRVSILAEVFSGVFPQSYNMTENFGHIRPRVSFGHHNHPNRYSSFGHIINQIRIRLSTDGDGL